MSNIITIRDLKFKYDDKLIFNNFNLDIKTGSWTTIVGPNGSGKSTLVRLMLGLLKSESSITINGQLLSDQTALKIRTQMGVIFENPDNQFVGQTVSDDLAFSLESLGYPAKEINKRIKETSQKFAIEDLLNVEPHALSGGQKQVIALAAALITKPNILILDEALTMTNQDSRAKIFRILTNLHQDTDLTIINVTHDMEESLYGDDIIVLDDGKIELRGPKEEILTQEKELHRLGLELPFMALLSIKLKYYNLIDSMIFDMDAMVNKLWK